MPRYEHDCEHCRFLGHVEEGGKLMDAYHCGCSLVVRWGDDEDERSERPLRKLPVIVELASPSTAAFRQAFTLYQAQ